MNTQAMNSVHTAAGIFSPYPFESINKIAKAQSSQQSHSINFSGITPKAISVNPTKGQRLNVLA